MTTNSSQASERSCEGLEPRALQDAKMHQHTYVSPSDNIMSPATQKLAAFKTKHLGKGLKPQTLFAKTAAANAAAAKDAQAQKQKATAGLVCADLNPSRGSRAADS